MIGETSKLSPFQPKGLNEEVRARLFRAVPCTRFPIHAHWFTGKLRLPEGRMLRYSHHGWSSVHERERVITVRQGLVTRERLVARGLDPTYVSVPICVAAMGP